MCIHYLIVMFNLSLVILSTGFSQFNINMHFEIIASEKLTVNCIQYNSRHCKYIKRIMFHKTMFNGLNYFYMNL